MYVTQIIHIITVIVLQVVWYGAHNIEACLIGFQQVQKNQNYKRQILEINQMYKPQQEVTLMIK